MGFGVSNALTKRCSAVDNLACALSHCYSVVRRVCKIRLARCLSRIEQRLPVLNRNKIHVRIADALLADALWQFRSFVMMVPAFVESASVLELQYHDLLLLPMSKKLINNPICPRQFWNFLDLGSCRTSILQAPVAESSGGCSCHVPQCANSCNGTSKLTSGLGQSCHIRYRAVACLPTRFETEANVFIAGGKQTIRQLALARNFGAPRESASHIKEFSAGSYDLVALTSVLNLPPACEVLSEATELFL